jgi:hypothetical protein
MSCEAYQKPCERKYHILLDSELYAKSVHECSNLVLLVSTMAPIYERLNMYKSFEKLSVCSRVFGVVKIDLQYCYSINAKKLISSAHSTRDSNAIAYIAESKIPMYAAPSTLSNGIGEGIAESQMRLASFSRCLTA